VLDARLPLLHVGYRIEPTSTGSRVTEWTEDLRPESAMEYSKQMSGIDDRDARNRHTMGLTLERLAAAVEARGARSAPTGRSRSRP
jgi:hypothetical protein